MAAITDPSDVTRLGRSLRLSKDDERLPGSSEAPVDLTCIQLIRARVA